MPVLVLRETTERPEGVAAGTLKLVGTKTEDVLDAMKQLLENSETHKKMATAKNPYGDGTAAMRILDILAYEFGQNNERPENFKVVDN
ncbi:MAG: UDP-N-acetylglucosamine 2-epimerase [Carnobacterium sp.]|nr:UDP-N-acetylglucosamine 2-epimerase [Carnobacterium sp.]